MAEKKRYWLKLGKDFLESKYIKIIKNMTNGTDYILFYLALMLESVETVGHLRFTDLVAYNEEMLSSLTDTNVDTVRMAVKIFTELGIIRILEDGTIFIPDVPRLTGKESDSAERVRAFREREKQAKIECNVTCNGDVTNCNDNKEEQEEKQEDKNKEEQRIETPAITQAKTLAMLLLSESRKHDEKLRIGKDKETIKSWAVDIEKLIRIDQREYSIVEQVIRWCKEDGNFWIPNILSGKKLRDKFPTLVSQMGSKPASKQQFSETRERYSLDIDKYDKL
ncbi:MAG: phage replisome organizer N-terminal domain-containing protein [Peptostreptococcaceae bacterium]|nr:phage replisome organizer N-terminal domain-containing protein [Peptostreptococcaceae bacterium]